MTAQRSGYVPVTDGAVSSKRSVTSAPSGTSTGRGTRRRFQGTPSSGEAGVRAKRSLVQGTPEQLVKVTRAGMRADVAVYAIDEPAELAWRFGGNPCLGTLRAGVPHFRSAR